MKAVIEILRGASGRLYAAIGVHGDGTTQRLAGPRDGPYVIADERIADPDRLIYSLREVADDLETRLVDERRKGGQS